MTWKQIESRRETRLWISQVIVPILVFAGTVISIPEARGYLKDKAIKIRDKIKTKFDK